MRTYNKEFSIYLSFYYLTLEGSGLSGNLAAATRNISGCGFPNFTSLSVLPMTLWLNNVNSSLYTASFVCTERSLDDVASAKGTLVLCKCRISLSAPESVLTVLLLNKCNWLVLNAHRIMLPVQREL